MSINAVVTPFDEDWEVEYEYVYEVETPTGFTRYRSTSRNITEAGFEELKQAAAGAHASTEGYKIKVRRRITNIWIGDWEDAE